MSKFVIPQSGLAIIFPQIKFSEQLDDDEQYSSVSKLLIPKLQSKLNKINKKNISLKHRFFNIPESNYKPAIANIIKKNKKIIMVSLIKGIAENKAPKILFNY